MGKADHPTDGATTIEWRRQEIVASLCDVTMMMLMYMFENARRIEGKEEEKEREGVDFGFTGADSDIY